MIYKVHNVGLIIKGPPFSQGFSHHDFPNVLIFPKVEARKGGAFTSFKAEIWIASDHGGDWCVCVCVF